MHLLKSQKEPKSTSRVVSRARLRLPPRAPHSTRRKIHHVKITSQIRPVFWDWPCRDGAVRFWGLQSSIVSQCAEKGAMADPLELEDAVTFLEDACKIFPDVTSILNTNQLLVLDADPKVHLHHRYTTIYLCLH